MPCPNTGASIDCVDTKFVKKHNIEIIPDTTKMIELISAEGKAMQVLGTCKLQIQNIGGHGFIETIALVCPNLSHNFLCSWITQKKLNLLHRGWPFVRLYNASAATLTEVLTTPRRLRPKTEAPDPKYRNGRNKNGQKNFKTYVMSSRTSSWRSQTANKLSDVHLWMWNYSQDQNRFLLKDPTRILYTGKRK